MLGKTATWRMTALCVATSLLMGVPLALTLTPVIYAAALLLADVVNYFTPLSPVLWRQADMFARLGVRFGDFLLNHKSADARTLIPGASVLISPGAALSSGLWIAILLIFRQAGIGGTLLSLKTRPPNRANFRELQLDDIVGEMAVAARLPRPARLLKT